jgi:hypothetical protein
MLGNARRLSVIESAVASPASSSPVSVPQSVLQQAAVVVGRAMYSCGRYRRFGR